jgi:hypothetical protein
VSVRTLLLGSDVVALAGSVAIAAAAGAMPLRSGALGVVIVFVIVLLSGTACTRATRNGSITPLPRTSRPCSM